MEDTGQVRHLEFVINNIATYSYKLHYKIVHYLDPLV